jgi:hypothetical protein
MWYYTFDLLNPTFVMQGGMLNQPAVDPETDAFYELLEDDFGNQFYETEISRRFSHFSQPIHQFGPSGVSAVLIVKQGIINQGGPADIFLRLTKLPDDVVWEDCELDGDETTVEQCLPEGYNPYAYENLVCEKLDGSSGWEYLPEGDVREGVFGSNPRYVQGLCTSNMINVSGTNIVSCDNGSSGEACADDFPWDGVEEGTSFPKVTEWSQSGPDYGEEITEDNIGNLDDQSWENPYDVSKGHRGFIDGDFIMMMYAWSPNWQANSVGNDHYNLYARRSFDGGKTWTTLPAEFVEALEIPEGVTVTADGTETCENYKNGTTITTICTPYGEGEFEQARNLSQLIGNKETILDPRYTPTGGIKMLPVVDLKDIGFEGYDDDVRDPSKFFIVYETGDNTTVAEGEAVPLDLFYSRSTDFGDEYDLVEYYNSGTGETTMGFDWLEHDREDLSGEAANTASPGGSLYYVIWNQWQEDEYENVSDSDAIFRRILYLDTEETEDAAPIATILYVSTKMVRDEEELVLIGTARDGDHVGEPPEDDIAEYEWTITYNGVTTVIDDGDDNPKQLNIPRGNLHPGWQGIGFRAKDKGGRWSPGVTVDIFVLENPIFIPIMHFND